MKKYRVLATGEGFRPQKRFMVLWYDLTKVDCKALDDAIRVITKNKKSNESKVVYSE